MNEFVCDHVGPNVPKSLLTRLGGMNVKGKYTPVYDTKENIYPPEIKKMVEC